MDLTLDIPLARPINFSCDGRTDTLATLQDASAALVERFNGSTTDPTTLTTTDALVTAARSGSADDVSYATELIAEVVQELPRPRLNSESDLDAPRRLLSDPARVRLAGIGALLAFLYTG